jgi:DNA-binding PadR family transcriptional regulator
MIYSVTINNKAIVDSGLSVSLQTAYLIGGIVQMTTNWQGMTKLEHDGRVFFWLDYNKLLSELPMLDLKPDSLYRALKAISDDGFLIPHPNNKGLKKSFYALSEKCYLLFGADIGKKSEYSEKNPNKSGKKSDVRAEKNPYNNSTKEKSTEDNEKQVFAHEENLQQPPTVQEVKEENAYTMGQAFAEAMRLEMQTRAEGLASYKNANNTFRPNANTFLEKCVLNIAAAAHACYRHENAKINLTPKVAQAYGCLLFNRFEALCENGNGTTRFLHTQTTFQQTLMQLSQYCEAFICDVLSEATMGGWETPKTDAAILADKYNKWLYTHKQTENLTKVRENVESADKAAKNAFSVAIGVLEDKEINMVNKAAKASKVNKRSVAADLKAATRRAYAAVMYMRTKDAIYNSSVDANGIPMGMEAERTGDAVYTAAYEIIKGNYKNW